MSLLRVLMVTSEVAPVAKTGGLADVTAALTAALRRAGHDVRLIVPLYRRLREGGRSWIDVPRLGSFELVVGRTPYQAALRRTEVHDGGPEPLELWGLDIPALYDREGIYTQDADEPVRFAALSHAALQSCALSGWAPDVVHAHDWHAAWLPLLIKGARSEVPALASAASVLTIHNIGYQGICAASHAPDLGLQGLLDGIDGADRRAGRINALKTGIVHADAVTTVSRTYARQIQEPEHGLGLQGALAPRRTGVVGIVNGIDDRVWNPAHDRHLPVRYTAATLHRKGGNTDVLLRRMGLLPKGEGPVFGVVSRLVWQKGLDLLADRIGPLLAQTDSRLVVLGNGESGLVESFRQVAARQPGRAAFHEGYSDELAHLIEGGADAFVMPSRYEPCGLNQMYSQRYGTVPIVHATGGLVDTVEPYVPDRGEGTGILFEHFDGAGLEWALRVAVALHGQRPHWRRMQENGMAVDFGWDRRAREYEELYRRVVAARARRRR